MRRLYEVYAESIQPGEVLTRREYAERVGRSKTTAFIQHLELAVREGLLHKNWFNLGDNDGWGYARPETMQHLFPMDGS